MTDFSLPALTGQLLLGLINGSFYALLSLGLAVIFGMLRVINFAHGAQYMMGAFIAWGLLQYAGLGYWPSLIVAPLVVGAFGWVLERTLVSRLYSAEHLYGLLLTFGVALIIEGAFRYAYGTSGQRYEIPAIFRGAANLGGVVFVPYYRGWVILASLLVCLVTWLVIEKTKLGSYLRAATDNPALVQAFGINVPLLMAVAYAVGAGLAGLAGVLAAPIYQVSPLMGQELMIIVFAVVVIGGMGSIMGSIIAGYGLGVLEGLTKYFYPEASNTIIFVAMIVVLLLRPAGLFGRETAEEAHAEADSGDRIPMSSLMRTTLAAVVVAVLAAAPLLLYPILAIKILIFALFAAAFNLLFGYAGLLSFGHAAFFGGASYVAGYAAKAWGTGPLLAIVIGVAFAAAIGAVFGYLAIRRRGIYFAMITLALSQMFYFLCIQMPFTGGENGLSDIPRGSLLGIVSLESNLAIYYFVAVVFIVSLLAIRRIVNSPFGDTLRAIRDNETRVISLGYNVNRYKLGVFVISAAFAGLAGALKALAFQFASLTDVAWHMSGEVILMTLLGGIGTLLGPVIGAGVVVAMTNYLSTTAFPVPVALGVIFVVCIIAFRKGVVGSARDWLWAWRSRTVHGGALAANVVVEEKK